MATRLAVQLNARHKVFLFLAFMATTAALTWYTALNPWVGLNGAASAVTINGYTLEWEWMDVGQSILFLEGNPQFRARYSWPLMNTGLSDQNATRMLPAVLISIFAPWTSSIWSGALLAGWAAWLLAYVATRNLLPVLTQPYPSSQRHEFASHLSLALLLATSPGYLAFVGSIDAHIFGYASVSLGLSLYIRIIQTLSSITTLSRTTFTTFAVFLGTTLFLFNATIHLGIPFSLFISVLLWCFSSHTLTLLRNLLFVISILVFLFLSIIWNGIAIAGSSGPLVIHNSVAGQLLLSAQILTTVPLFDVISRIIGTFFQTFGWVVSVSSIVGWFRLTSPNKLWTISWVVLIASATALIRPLPRTIYLCYPIVYILAADAFGYVASYPWAQQSTSPLMRHAPLYFYLILAAIGLERVGAIWGEQSIPGIWWPPEP